MTAGLDCSIGFIWRDILIVHSGLWIKPEVLKKSGYSEQWFTLKMNARLEEICECYWRNWLTLDASNTIYFMTGIHWGTLTMADVIDSEVFLAFSTYATIVILKMMSMSFLTAYFRITRKVREDTHLRCISLLAENRVWSMEYFNNTGTYRTLFYFYYSCGLVKIFSCHI